MSSPLAHPTPRAIPGALEARIERALEGAVARASPPGAPPRLREAIAHAVFPGGGRLRPQLCILASLACGDRDPSTSDAAATAVELMHCASLVHDDLPCFDDADTRRGRASVHKAFGEATAVLVGDALIVQSFAEVVRTPRAAELGAVLAEAAGGARGVVAGQAWEAEPKVALDAYHRAKTASLFEAAAAMGALASGADPAPWRAFGEALGRVYQSADDIADASADATSLGKPVGRDRDLARPSVVATLGLDGARTCVEAQLEAARRLVPRGPGELLVRAWVEHLATRAGV
ncbi:MAG: polyprenyl synthetase family protein [Deltaproteobacteria bacterium]|nr:polyprenyl synthetase family protein [Deltaproteobacteria bacterium]